MTTHHDPRNCPCTEHATLMPKPTDEVWEVAVVRWYEFWEKRWKEAADQRDERDAAAHAWKETSRHLVRKLATARAERQEVGRQHADGSPATHPVMSGTATPTARRGEAMTTDEYVPDEETVREQYSREQPPHIGTVGEKRAELDRFLARVRRDAVEEYKRSRGTVHITDPPPSERMVPVLRPCPRCGHR